jgi:hypothetical protein
MTAPADRRRGFRRIGIAAVALVATAACLLLAGALRRLTPESLAREIETLLSGGAGGTVTAAAADVRVASVSLAGPRSVDLAGVEVRVRGARIPWLRIARVRARIGAIALLVHGRVELSDVVLEQAEIEVAEVPHGAVVVPSAPLAYRDLAVRLRATWSGVPVVLSVFHRAGAVDPSWTGALVSSRPITARLPDGLEGEVQVDARGLAGGGSPVAVPFSVHAGWLAWDGATLSSEGLDVAVAGVRCAPGIRWSRARPAPCLEVILPETRFDAVRLAGAAGARAGTLRLTLAVRGAAASPEVAAELGMDSVRLALPVPPRGREVVVESGTLVMTPAPAPSGGLLVVPQGVRLIASPAGPRRVVVVVERGDVVVRPGSVRVHDLTVSIPGGPRLTGSGAVRAAGASGAGPGEPLVELSLAAADVDLMAAVRAVDDPIAGALTALGASGRVDVAIALDGPLSRPAARASIALLSGRLRLGAGPEAGTAAPAEILRGGRITAAADGRIDLDGVRLRVLDTEAAARGRIDPAGAGGDRTVALELTAPRAGARALLELAGAPRELAAVVSGRMDRVAVAVVGSIRRPEVSASLDLAGARIGLRGLDAPVPILAGQARLTPGRLSVASADLALGGARTTARGAAGPSGRSRAHVAGTVDLTGEGALALSVESQALPVSVLALPVPEAALSGTVAIDARISGPPAAPSVAGTIGLAGLVLELAALPGAPSDNAGASGAGPGRRAALRGTARIAGGRVTLAGASLEVAGESLALEGTIDTSGEGGPRAAPVRIAGNVDLERVLAGLGAARNGAAGPAAPFGRVRNGSAGDGAPFGRASIRGRARVDLVVTGALADPETAGRVTASSVILEHAGRSLSIADLDVRVAVDSEALSLPAFSGRLLGGASVSGNVAPDGAFALACRDLHLHAITPSGPGSVWKEGKLSFELTGDSGLSLAELELDGRLRVDGLAVDMSRSKTLSRMKTRSRAGETGSALASGLLGATGLGVLAGASAAQAHFYGDVFDEALAVHAIGRVAARLRVRESSLALTAIEGPNVKGRITCGLADGRLAGKLDFVQLGRARFLDVSLGGTLLEPEPTVASGNVRLAGKAPPGGRGRSEGALNLKTLVKPGVGMVVGWPLSVVDLILPRLFGRKKRRPRAGSGEPGSAAPSPRPSPAPARAPSPAAAPGPRAPAGSGGR